MGTQAAGATALQRSWSAVELVARGLVAALVTAWAEPAPLHPALQRRLWLPFRGRVRVNLLVVGDVLLGLALYTGTASALLAANELAGEPYSGEFTLLLAAACSFPVLLRIRAPLAAWRCALPALAWASVPLQRLLEVPIPPGGTVMYLLCLYTLATRSTREVTVGAGVASVLVLWVNQLWLGGGSLRHPSAVLAGTGLVLVPLVFGHNLRERRQAQREVAEQRRRNEEQQAARSVLLERARIARELHDVVAHHMSVIAIQAEAAPLRTPDIPDEARRDLADIRRTALEALTELRRVLGVLRQEDGEQEAAPQPGLERLDELADNALAAGLDVTVEMRGPQRPLPPGVDVSAYRIVQESLSNVMRHAPGAAVRVRVTFRDEPAEVEVRIENAPPPGGPPAAADAGARHGLVGMRERAAMLGGELTAGPSPAGGFVVVATLPLEVA